jgi:hypothetical protein
MADVTIEGSVLSATARGQRSEVFTSENVGYQFFIDGADSDFFYLKTTDGGATWGGPVEIDTDTTIACLAFDVWYDQWTPGDSGTKIHIAWMQSDIDGINYRALDTNGDSLGSQVLAFDGATTATGSGVHCSIAKMRGGNLYIVTQIDAGAEFALVRSTDGGANWGARTNPIEAIGDFAFLFPGNESDANDAWLLYFDSSTTELTLKVHDDSADTNSESSVIAVTAASGNDLRRWHVGGSIRHSDGHLICTTTTAYDLGSNDHRVLDVNGSGSITELTAILSNTDDHYLTAVFIDQTTNDIYVAYLGKKDGSESLGTAVTVYYTKSTDGGASWSAGDTAYMEGAADNLTWICTPLMGPRFYVSWIRDSTILEGNAVNSLTFGGAPPAGDGGLPWLTAAAENELVGVMQ